jgi:F-type H+-transporting ATPase subunit gamma
MLTTRDIRRRIRSIGSTSQITRAMQMVAASKMRKAQQAALDARPFAQLLYRIQRSATTQSIEFTHPLLEVRPVRQRAVILIATDKGLCGGLNTNLFRVAAEFDSRTTTFITAGRKASQFIARTGRQLAAEFTYSDTPLYPESRAIAAFARDLFLKGEVDEVRLVAARFVNTLTQVTSSIEYLPVGPITTLKIPGAEPEEELATHAMDYQFEPSAATLLGYLLPVYLNTTLYMALLNAKASEQSARMVSMKNATDSANSLIKDLTLEYNKLRQGAITTELLDIAGGQVGAG